MPQSTDTQTTGLRTELMQTYYDNVFLERFSESLVIGKWVDVKNIPLYKGKTINWFRYYPLTYTTTAITEGKAADTNFQVDFSGQTLTATVSEYAEWLTYSKMLAMTARDPELRQLSELFGEAAAKVVDQLLLTECIQNGSFPVRTDLIGVTATTKEMAAGQVNATSALTTYCVVGTIATTAAWYSGGFACVYDGTNNYGHGSTMATSSTASGLVLNNAAPTTWSQNNAYIQVATQSGTDKVAVTDTISGTAIRYAVAKGRQLKFYPYDGGFFRCALDAYSEYDLLADTVYQAISEYQRASDIDKAFIKQIWGAEMYRITMPYRCTLASYAYSATGGVFCTPVMGRHALGRVDLAGQSAPKIIVKNPGPNSTNDPYDENSTVAYKIYMASKALNAAFAVNLIHGVTGVTPA